MALDCAAVLFEALGSASRTRLRGTRGITLRFLIVGLGSIGRRHVRNLRTLLGEHAEIIAFRALHQGRPINDENSLSEVQGVRSFRNLDDALRQRPIVALICNPTSVHVPVATAAALEGCHLFIEKPVSHSAEGLDVLQTVARERNLKTLVGFQFRFHPGLIAVRDLIQTRRIGRVIRIAAHWGEYLPGWHPGEDYRQSYAARSDLGGGTILTLCHPFDYLRWMLGEVRAVTAITGHSGCLGIKVEDSADVLLEFRSGAIATVHLNYVQRPPSHWLEAVGTSGTITWNSESGDVRWFHADTNRWASIPAPDGFDRNAMFLAEMRHFLDCVANDARPLTPLEDGINTLDVTLAAKQSAKERRTIEVLS